MAALPFDALLKGLKQGAAPVPVYYLHGEEDVLKEEAVRALNEGRAEDACRLADLAGRLALRITSCSAGILSQKIGRHFEVILNEASKDLGRVPGDRLPKI